MSEASETWLKRAFLGAVITVIIILLVSVTSGSDPDAPPESSAPARDAGASVDKASAPSSSVESSSGGQAVSQGVVVAKAPEQKQLKAIDDPKGRLKKPKEVAMRALKALKNSDFESLLVLVPQDRIDSVRERWGPGTERYAELFGDGGWQQSSVQEWTGEILSLRVKRNVQALVKYGEWFDEGVTKHLCVSLLNLHGDGTWYFKDLDARPDDAFVDYGDEVDLEFVSPPPPPAQEPTAVDPEPSQ